MLPRSLTVVLERNMEWVGTVETEPHEVAWAHEAVFFVRVLEGESNGCAVNVQISPDGLHWVDEGSSLEMPPTGGVAFCRVSHFGDWLRVKAEVARPVRVVITLSLKE